MIIFYPPTPCTPVVIADMLDSSDQWSVSEITAAVLHNKPASTVIVGAAAVYSCKYSYTLQHVGVPLGASLKMTLQAAIKTPPAELISQVSVKYVSSAQSIGEMTDALSKFANPQLTIMSAVVVERTADSSISRTFVAYSSLVQPDSYGVTTTLIIKGASLDDTLIKSAVGFQLNTTTPLKTQLEALAGSLGYTCTFDAAAGAAVPVCGRLFQPTTLPKMLDEICIQNKLIPTIDEKAKKIHILSQGSVPIAGAGNNKKFSFLGYAGSIIWGAGIENYANVKFNTSIFNAVLFDKITLFDDHGQSSVATVKANMFAGLKKDAALSPTAPDSFTLYILRYAIIRTDTELYCEVTATNNWLLAQIRVDGVFESAIYGGSL